MVVYLVFTGSFRWSTTRGVFDLTHSHIWGTFALILAGVGRPKWTACFRTNETCFHSAIPFTAFTMHAPLGRVWSFYTGHWPCARLAVKLTLRRWRSFVAQKVQPPGVPCGGPWRSAAPWASPPLKRFEGR